MIDAVSICQDALSVDHKATACGCVLPLPLPWQGVVGLAVDTEDLNASRSDVKSWLRRMRRESPKPSSVPPSAPGCDSPRINQNASSCVHSGLKNRTGQTLQCRFHYTWLMLHDDTLEDIRGMSKSGRLTCPPSDTHPQAGQNGSMQTLRQCCVLCGAARLNNSCTRAAVYLQIVITASLKTIPVI